MHEYGSTGQSGDTALPGLIRALRDLPVAPDDAVRVDQIRQLEEIKSAAAAAQAEVTSAFVGSQRAQQRAAGIPEQRCERGIAGRVALAKRVSPYHARRYVGWSRILTSELPETFARLQNGQVSEWRAMLVARETAWLSREHRAAVDRELAPQLEQLGDKRVEAEAKKIGYRLDPDGYLNRLRQADSDRRVSLRPAPDVMARLTALLPVREGVASHAALAREADARRAAGDPRTRGQLMADILIERVTGRAGAGGIPVEVSLTMGADTLLAPAQAGCDAGGAHADTSTHDTSTHDTRAHDEPESDTGGADDVDDVDDEPAPAPTAGRDEPAYLHGYGPIPAPLARDWLLDPDRSAPTWLRRLFTRPDTGQLIGMDSRRRLFTPNQAHYLRLRDQVCRTPWCEAPIRHADHIIPVEQGGTTSIRNAEGLCEACNYAKEAPGWHARPGPAGTITITTPTGHRYRSRPPQPPGSRPTGRSPLERQLEQHLTAHLRAA